MKTPQELDAQAAEVKQLIEQGYSQRQAAAMVGISRTSLQRRLVRAEGFPAGFQVASVSETEDEGGNVTSRSTRYVPERKDAAPPPGMALQAISRLEDASGGMVQEWRKYRTDAVSPEHLAETLLSALANIRPTPAITPAPAGINDDLLHLLPKTDAHMGMRSWRPETGEDYDLSAAVELHRRATADLVGRLPVAHTAIVLNCGDEMHANDGKNVTPGAGHSLDTDGQYQEVLEAAIQSEIDRVEMAKSVAGEVIYRMVPGNHDPEAAVGMVCALRQHYRLDARVRVVADQRKWWHYRWGASLIAATHGHEIKPAHMKGYLADVASDEWSATKWRFIYYGHFHRQEMIRDGSTLIECLGTLAARDAWAAPKFSGGRLMQAKTFCKSRGLLRSEQYNHCEAT